MPLKGILFSHECSAAKISSKSLFNEDLFFKRSKSTGRLNVLFRLFFGCIIFASDVVVRSGHLLTFCEGRGILLQRLAPSPLTVIGSRERARHIFLEPLKYL